MRGFGHIERMHEEEFTRKVYDSIIKVAVVRGKPPVTWANREEEYWREMMEACMVLLWPPP